MYFCLQRIHAYCLFGPSLKLQSHYIYICVQYKKIVYVGCLFNLMFIPHTTGILVGFDERFVQVREEINNSINICGFLSSLTGIWKSDLSAILVVPNSTAKGLFYLAREL